MLKPKMIKPSVFQWSYCILSISKSGPIPLTTAHKSAFLFLKPLYLCIWPLIRCTVNSIVLTLFVYSTKNLHHFFNLMHTSCFQISFFTTRKVVRNFFGNIRDYLGSSTTSDRFEHNSRFHYDISWVHYDIWALV